MTTEAATTKCTRKDEGPRRCAASPNHHTTTTSVCAATANHGRPLNHRDFGLCRCC